MKIYSRDIRLYNCKFSNLKSNSGKRVEYPKFQIRIKFCPILSEDVSDCFIQFYTPCHACARIV